MGVHGKRNAPQIVADAAEGKLNKILVTYLKAVKQPGQALRTTREANDLFIRGLYDEINKLAPIDQKNAKKILESFGIAEKGAFNPTAVHKFVEWATMLVPPPPKNPINFPFSMLFVKKGGKTNFSFYLERSILTVCSLLSSLSR